MDCSTYLCILYIKYWENMTTFICVSWEGGMGRKGEFQPRGWTTGLKLSFLSAVVICKQQNRSYKVQEMCQVRSCPPEQNKIGDVTGITYGRSGSTLTWFCSSPFSICNALWGAGHGQCPIFFFLCTFFVSHIPASRKARK